MRTRAVILTDSELTRRRVILVLLAGLPPLWLGAFVVLLVTPGSLLSMAFMAFVGLWSAALVCASRGKR